VGRIGDTPQMGCGFWAEEWKVSGLWDKITGKKVRAVGVSGTGDGDV
jgi:isoaspartyl peptidase/L-asparaginase-like protein (Ntn-hydrolase superfamily)